MPGETNLVPTTGQTTIAAPPQGVPATPFQSILFSGFCIQAAGDACKPLAFFPDLNLDQVITSITAGWDEYDLKPFFLLPLSDADEVVYRHEVFKDLENDVLLGHVQTFADKMRSVREHAAQAGKLTYKGEKEVWFLDAVDIYCEAVRNLTAALSSAPLRSRGFLALRDYFYRYSNSDHFTALASDTRGLRHDLSSIEYRVLIKGASFQVSRYEPTPDYSVEVEKTFEKFRLGEVQDYKAKYSPSQYMNHIEAKILEFVIEQHPEVFGRLAEFYGNAGAFVDPPIAAFDREVHFYLANIKHTQKLKSAGLPFCYPEVTSTSREVYAFDAFDLALAHKLTKEKRPIVCNDFSVRGCERIIVVTGPNQGGKTTFARMFGQMHYLARLGLPVPGRKARLFLFDMIFTHFEKEEKAETLRGKLQDDLIRVHEILSRANPNCIVILNEIFTSTALTDAIYLSRAIMRRLAHLGLLAVWVTFLDELASFGEQTVSMVSNVVADNPTLRTFKIERKPPDGFSHAMSIAEKYGVTYRRLTERLQS